MADAGFALEAEDFLRYALAAQRAWLVEAGAYPCVPHGKFTYIIAVMPLLVTVDEAGHNVVKIPSRTSFVILTLVSVLLISYPEAVLDRILGKCGSCGTSSARLDHSDLNELVAGADPAPVAEEPIDLTDPFHALAATPAALMVLDDESKSLLRFNIQTFRPDLRGQFSREQCWAFNANNVPIPIREESGTGGPAVYHILRSEGDSGKRLHISGSATSRWYCIARGRGFTGIARGASISVAATVGVKFAFSVKCGSKAEAEYYWLKYREQGDTEALPEPDPVRPPARPPVVASAPRSRRATHVYDLDSDSDDAVDKRRVIDLAGAKRRGVIDLTNAEDTVGTSDAEEMMEVSMNQRE
jgi:hypothetical protein